MPPALPGDWLLLNKVDRKTSHAAANIRDRLQTNHGDLFSGVFGYSAMEVLALRDLGLEEALADLATRVRAHVSHREAFSFPLQARKEGRRYWVELEGEQRALTGIVPEGAYTERDVVLLLRRAIETKRDLLRQRLERDLNDYRSLRGQIAARIREVVQAEADALRDQEPEGFARALTFGIRELCDEYEASLSSAVDTAVRSALEKRSLSKAESFHVKWPSWRIVLNPQKVRSGLEPILLWNELETDLNRLVVAVGADSAEVGDAAQRALPTSAIKDRILDAVASADRLLPAIEREFPHFHAGSFATHVIRAQEDAETLLGALREKLTLRGLGAFAVEPIRDHLEELRTLALQGAGMSQGRDAAMLEGLKSTAAKVAELEQLNA
jgi:hypothetical protein